MMKHKNFLVLTLLVLGLFFTKSAKAIITKDEVMQKRDEIQEKRGEVEEIKEQVKDQIQEKKEDLSQKMQQTRTQILEKHANRLQNRFMNIYYPRLEKLINKFQERLNLMSKNGKDITTAQAKLYEASAKLAEAKVYAEQSISEFQNIEPEKYEAQRQLALGAKETAENARLAFKEVHELLKQVLSLAKKAQ